MRAVFNIQTATLTCCLGVADVVDASVVHMVTRPVDTSQQPPQPSQRERVPHGGAGQFTANMMGGQGFGVPMDMNDFGSVGVWGNQASFLQVQCISFVYLLHRCGKAGSPIMSIEVESLSGAVHCKHATHYGDPRGSPCHAHNSAERYSR